MPDLREVFEMSTQKVKPDPGYVDRQHDHQRTTERRRKAGAIVVAAALGLAAIVMIVESSTEGTSSRPAGTSSTPSFPAILGPPFIVDLGSGARTPLSSDMAGGVLYSASPDGTQIAFGHCCTQNDEIDVANIDGTGIHPITPTGGLAAYGPVWSPDGTKVVYQLRDAATYRFGSLVVQDVATGATTKLATIQGMNGWWLLSPSFSRDGRTVLFQVARDPSGWDTWSVPATGGTPTRVLRNAGFAQYFPDGRRIAFVSGMSTDLSGPRISVATADGARRTLVKANVAIFRPMISPDGTRIAYRDGTSIDVVVVSTGASKQVATGSSVAWLDDHTLIVGP